MKLRRGSVALLVIDVERDFVDGPMAVSGARELVGRLVPVVAAARGAGVPVVFAVQALRADELGPLERFEEVRRGSVLRDGTPGVEVVPELGPEPGDVVVTKRRFSAFMQTDLDLLLRARRIEQLVVCGLSAHVCCDTTVRDAFQLGYEPVYLVDGVEMGDLPDLGWGPIGADQAKAVVATAIAHRFGETATIADFLAALAAG